jgi:flagellar export protein FliJ
MKRFTFRLERLLQLREAMERDQAQRLGMALRTEEERRLAAEAGERRLAEAREQYGTTPRDLSQAGTLRNLELAVAALADELAARSRAHEESLAALETERHKFEQARMARRVLERLREHRRDTWGEELSRFEQALNDEAAIQRAQTGSRETV